MRRAGAKSNIIESKSEISKGGSTIDMRRAPKNADP